MGLIRLHVDPFGAEPVEPVAWSGPYIEWLQARYPDGIERPHQSRLNGELLAVADYDTPIGAGDVVDLVLYPAGPVGAAIGSFALKALVGLAVSVAVNYAANALFGAKPAAVTALQPRVSKTPTPGTVYSINAPRNEARIGQPVECQYGRVRCAPSLATSPYTVYDANNVQWLYVILRLGHGEHQVHEVYASDTPASQMKPGTLGYHVLTPAWHGSEWGRIQTHLGIYEDVDTSVEVSQIELPPGQGFKRYVFIDYEASTLYWPEPLPGDVIVGGGVLIWFQYVYALRFTIQSISADRRVMTTAESLDPYGDSRASIYETKDVYTLPFGDPWNDDDWRPTGTEIYFSSSTDLSAWTGASATATLTRSDGKVYVLTGELAGAYPGYLVIWDVLPWPMVEYLEEWVSVAVTVSKVSKIFATALRTGDLTGPFVVCAEGRTTRLVGFDLEWPYGLYRVRDEDGALLIATVYVDLYLDEIDDAGNLTGGLGYFQRFTMNAATNTPQRRTVWMACGGKRYRASANVASEGTGRAQDQFKTFWTGLKAVLEHWGQPAYGAVTLLAMWVRASDGLSTDAAQRITVDSTRLLEGAATSNPAAAVRDLWTNTEYGAGRSLAELDSAALAALEADAAEHNGFNFRFENQVSVWNALRTVVRPLDWFPVPLAGVVSFAKDGPSDVVAAYFRGAEDDRGAANMFDAAVAMQWDEQGAHDGYEVEYISATRHMPEYVVYPPDASDPETVPLEGCTDAATAARFCEGLWARRQYRREWLEWQSELEGAILPIGSKVLVSHRLVGTDVPYIIQSVEPRDEGRHSITAWRYDERQYVA